MKCPRCGEDMKKIGGTKLIASFFSVCSNCHWPLSDKRMPKIDPLFKETLGALLRYVIAELGPDREDEKEYFKDLLNRLKAWPSKDRQD